MRGFRLSMAIGFLVLASGNQARADAGAAIEALTRQQIVSLCEDRHPYSNHLREICIEKQRIGKAGVDRLRGEMWHLHYSSDASDRRLSDTMRLFDKVCENKVNRLSPDQTDWVEQFNCFKHKIDEAAAAGRVLLR
ncbi:hypothetical protein [Bradyrhizobium sp. WSM3983]|uniref:hypothetical protein n=1 Tax=Bradyrhizobium sp. WSM3983 TaxID=1038867 RepID=UPI0012EC151B|nr:hypothetical protein [Bradyrhizobium sp. WSM3983]